MSQARSANWTRDQLLLAFRLYCQTPFGRLHNRNPEIVQLAALIGRTANALAMKACNFASLDPAIRTSGRHGLSGASTADRAIWNEFSANSEALAAAAEEAYDRLAATAPVAGSPAIPEPELPTGPTDVLRTIRARRVQRFFSNSVLAAYEYKCALTGLAVRDLLNASHIIPWSVDESRRADPRNGICLNALYDRAFDRGLITFDDSLRVVISTRLKGEPMDRYQREMVEQVENQQLRLPCQFQPDMEAVMWHRLHAATLAENSLLQGDRVGRTRSSHERAVAHRSR